MPGFRVPFAVQLGLAAAIGVGGVTAVTSPETVGSLLASNSASTDCVIKGNISLNTGERIYHVPGQKYYAATRISTEHGERWFCSEAEARANGWRKARV